MVKSDDSKLKEKLLDAALRLFAERGRDGVSLRDIANVAGATHGSIRHHFGTKDRLYVAAVMQLDPIDLPGCNWPGRGEVSPEEASDHLRSMIRAFVSYQVRVGANRNAALGLLRAEMSRYGRPDPVFYRRVIHPGHEKMKDIIQSIRPDIDDDKTLEILAFNIIFQCVMVRIGRGIILKRLGQRTLRRDDTDQISHLIAETTLIGLKGLEL